MPNQKEPKPPGEKEIPAEKAKAEPKEKLLKVMAEQSFVDGNLAGFMADYGYPVEWPRNETRELPKWLIERCISSGADLVDGR